MGDLDFTEEQEAQRSFARMESELQETESYNSIETAAPAEVTISQQKASGFERMATLAMSKDNGVEIIRELIKMQNEQEDRENKRTFDEHFAQMRKELPPIGRNKQGDKAKYAPIEDIQTACDPIISKYGFMYSFREEPLDNGGLRTFLTISGHGHEKENYVDMPPYQPDTNSSGKAIMNAMQAEGVRRSYGRRYAFLAGFAPVVVNEDTDGAMLTIDNVVKYSSVVEEIRCASTIDEVKQRWLAARKKFADDPIGLKAVNAAKEEAKRIING